MTMTSWLIIWPDASVNDAAQEVYKGARFLIVAQNSFQEALSARLAEGFKVEFRLAPTSTLSVQSLSRRVLELVLFIANGTQS